MDGDSVASYRKYYVMKKSEIYGKIATILLNGLIEHLGGLENGI